MDPSDPRTLSSSTSTLAKRDVPLKEMGPNSDLEARSSGSTDVSTAYNDAQAGVKNIEAVSMTWTKWGLIAAYARFVGT